MLGQVFGDLETPVGNGARLRRFLEDAISESKLLVENRFREGLSLDNGVSEINRTYALTWLCYNVNGNE